MILDFLWRNRCGGRSRGKSFLAPNILPLFRAGKSGNVGARQSMLRSLCHHQNRHYLHVMAYSQNMHMKRDLITSSRYICTVLVGKQTGSREKEKKCISYLLIFRSIGFTSIFLCVTSNIFLLNFNQMNSFLYGKFIWFSVFDIQFSDLTFLGTYC